MQTIFNNVTESLQCALWYPSCLVVGGNAAVGVIQAAAAVLYNYLLCLRYRS